MIVSFKCSKTEALFKRRSVAKEWHDIGSVALRKLNYLHVCKTLEDLKIPPGNHLEKLQHDRKGQYSIRINRKWRICFAFEDTNVGDVEIVDYHKG